MFFKQIKSGGDRNFAYLIAGSKTGGAALVDPSPDPALVMEEVAEEGVTIKYIINTHSHSDHSSGNKYFLGLDAGNRITFINCGPLSGPKQQKVLKLGELKLEIIETPGHTGDSICIKAGNKLITGDTLFVGKVGGTYGEEDAREEFESLKKITTLPPDTEVWPGHDYGVKPYSTIGFELKNNPFIFRLQDFSKFLQLKENWARYKLEHGIK